MHTKAVTCCNETSRSFRLCCVQEDWENGVPMEGAHHCPRCWQGLHWQHPGQGRTTIELMIQAWPSEWMKTHSFLWWPAGALFRFIPLLIHEKKKLLRMTAFSAMVEKWFLLVSNDIIMYQCTIKSNCNTVIGLIFFYYVKYVFQLLKNVKLNVAHLIKKSELSVCMKKLTIFMMIFFLKSIH